MPYTEKDKAVLEEQDKRMSQIVSVMRTMYFADETQIKLIQQLIDTHLEQRSTYMQIIKTFLNNTAE